MAAASCWRALVVGPAAAGGRRRKRRRRRARRKKWRTVPAMVTTGVGAGAEQQNRDVVIILGVDLGRQMEIVSNTIRSGQGRQIGNLILGHQHPRPHVGRAGHAPCSIRTSGQVARPAGQLARGGAIPPRRSGRIPCIRIVATDISSNRTGSDLIGADRWIVMICVDKNPEVAMP